MSHENEAGLREMSGDHERLCAYVLGEGSPAERAEIERELAQSPVLRAEHDRIARTIACVQDALVKSETMSPEAARHVAAAARDASGAAAPPPRGSTWYAVPWMRLAAGVGAIALGVALVQRSDRATWSESSLELARSSGARDADATRRSGAAKASNALGTPAEGVSVGFAEPTSPAVAAKLGADPRATSASTNASREMRDETVEYRGLSVEGAPKAEETQLAFDPATKKPAGTAQPVSVGRVVDTPGLVTVESKVRPDASVAAIPPTSDAKDGTPSSGPGTTAGDLFVIEEAIAGGGGATGADSLLQRGGNGGAGAKVSEREKSKADDDKLVRLRSAGGLGAGGSSRTSDAGGAPAPARPSGPATGGGSFAGMPPGTPGAEAQKKSAAPAPTAGAGGGSGFFERGPATAGPASPAGAGANAAPGITSAPEQRVLGLQDHDAEDEATVREKLETVGYAGGETAPAVPYYRLTPAEQQAYLDRECRRILVDCRPRPNERPRDMFFRFWGDNPFEVTALDPQSTFAADVDTASYALARRYVEEGHVPDKAQIRTEEFVNYFDSGVPAPTNAVFAVRTDLAPSRFSTDTSRQMLRVVVRGKEMSKVERKPMNLTFVVDVSGSMREQNRLEMVKHAIRLLVTQLDSYDRIAIVKFSTDAQRVLDLTPVRDRAAIESAIMPLAPEGSTNSNAGLELGYGIAVAGFDPNATNRVVFLSDGVANVGETDPAKIAERVKPMREKGIYLNTIGVGMNNHNDVLLEQLADKADGMCAYIDTPDEAKKQLVDNFSGAFQPIARDVKIQVEFDPRQVLRYRLLGYENRAIADADFRNDKVDAGELGAGHTVTALYEIERQGGAAADGPLATVRVRWKDPSTFGLPSERDTASEMSHTVLATQATTFEGAGQGYRKAVLAGQFAELLRRSVHARGDSVDDLLNEALRLQKEIPNDATFAEFVLLVSKAKDAILRTMPVCDELCQAVDQVREFEYRRQQLASLQRDLDARTLDELRRQNDELEARLRDMVRRRLESQGR